MSNKQQRVSDAPSVRDTGSERTPVFALVSCCRANYNLVP